MGIIRTDPERIHNFLAPGSYEIRMLALNKALVFYTHAPDGQVRRIGAHTQAVCVCACWLVCMCMRATHRLLSIREFDHQGIGSLCRACRRLFPTVRPPSGELHLEQPFAPPPSPPSFTPQLGETKGAHKKLVLFSIAHCQTAPVCA